MSVVDVDSAENVSKPSGPDCGASGLGARIKGLGFGFESLGFKGLGFKGLRFRVKGLGLKWLGLRVEAFWIEGFGV